MQIIEHEIKKYDMWREELRRKKKSVDSATGGSDKTALKKDYEKTKKKFDGLVKKQDQLLRGMVRIWSLITHYLCQHLILWSVFGIYFI